MKSTGAILTPDEPFRRSDRQHFGKKRHPNFGNRLFHPPIGSMALITCPEMTLFSNDTGAFPGYKVLGNVPGLHGPGSRSGDPGSVTGAGPGEEI